MSSVNPTTREKILSAAWALLEENPHEETRMGDIAEAAGVSRQTVYGHFPSRAELLIATARYLDEVKKVDDRLAKSRQAATGRERLPAFIDAWGGYIPEIHGVSKAFRAMQDTDEAAAAAWGDRMQAVRHGCEAAVTALKRDEALAPAYSVKQATDILWMLLSVENWERLRLDCGWSQKKYIEAMKEIAEATLVA